MLRDYVKKYYLEQRRNCAESLLRAANEAYGLNLTEADFALLSGFGGGMGGDCSCIIWILIILCCCGGNNGFGGFGCGC